MFIRRLFIKNYRCFGEQPTIVELSESGITALIGPNNVGKSTILKVLEILLGDKWPSSQFNEDDFHENRLSKEIVLACEFNSAIPVSIYGQGYNVAGVVLKARHIESGFGESSVETDYHLIDSVANLENENWTLIASKYGHPVRVSQEAKNQLPVVITVPLLKLHSEQPSNKWSVLGRMLQKVERVLIGDESRKNSFQKQMKEAMGLLREPGDFQKIENDIKEFWKKMKPNNLGGTHLEFLDYEPWRYYRQFKLAITRNGQEVPIETLGEGVQRLATIAIYRTYLRNHGRKARAILLIEEPESYLHPQARRTLFTVLKLAIKEKGEIEGQIVYTTHSEDFVDCGDFDDIVIFAQLPDSIETRHLKEDVAKQHTIALGYAGDNPGDPHIHYRLIETITQGLKEALFAHKAVIVEGPTEVELLRFFSGADKNQIAVVSAGGKSNTPSVYSFLTGFGIPCLVITDRDEIHDGENNKIIEVLTQNNAEQPDSSRMNITEADIKRVADGQIFKQERLLVFGKKLEQVLENRISGYRQLVSELSSTFNIPADSKPRIMHALGLAYNRVCGGNLNLERKMSEIKGQLAEITSVLNDFIGQDINRPSILKPKVAETHQAREQR